MQEFLNSHTISSEIRLLRTAFAGSFLIVEGDTDKRVLQHFTDSKDCQIKIAYNKDNAAKVIEILNADVNFTGAIAIVDADFQHLEESENISNLFKTDFHDLECLIFNSPALEKVLAEFASDAKIKSFGKDIRETIFEIGCFIGYLRWLSLSDGLNLKFEELDFGKFISKDNLKFDLDLFVTAVKNKSQRHDLNNAQICSNINNLASPNHAKHQVACGKDLVEILSLALQKVLGTNNSNKVTSEIIARDLRLAYEFEFFILTELYQNIKGWELQNFPFKVFR